MNKLTMKVCAGFFAVDSIILFFMSYYLFFMENTQGRINGIGFDPPSYFYIGAILACFLQVWILLKRHSDEGIDTTDDVLEAIAINFGASVLCVFAWIPLIIGYTLYKIWFFIFYLVSLPFTKQTKKKEIQ